MNIRYDVKLAVRMSWLGFYGWNAQVIVPPSSRKWSAL